MDSDSLTELLMDPASPADIERVLEAHPEWRGLTPEEVLDCVRDWIRTQAGVNEEDEEEGEETARRVANKFVELRVDFLWDYRCTHATGLARGWSFAIFVGWHSR